MALRNVLTVDTENDSLRKRSREVDKIDEKILSLIEDMKVDAIVRHHTPADIAAVVAVLVTYQPPNSPSLKTLLGRMPAIPSSAAKVRVSISGAMYFFIEYPPFIVIFA